MEIVELIDKRFLPLYCRHHLKGCKDHFSIFTIINGESRTFLVWPGGEVKIRHARSNKQMRGVKTKPLRLTKNPVRCLIGSFGGSLNWMQLDAGGDDYWTIYYDPAMDVRIMDEIKHLLERLKP